MNLLVIGIDGGTADIFDAFDMPFWQSLRQQDVTFDVTEDLNQRGWARMLSGQNAAQNGGLYMRPILDSGRKFDISYNYKMMSASEGFIPIWNLAAEKGARVGIMNVPTTSPAQEVPGFYVAGGGGGIFQGGLPDGAVFPAEVAKDLENSGYIFDTRLGAQKFAGIEEATGHIEEMMRARTTAYVALAKAYEIDFGFLAFRATTVLFYLAMSEIAHAMRHPQDSPHRRTWSDGWLPIIESHLRTLDDQLARLFDELQPAHHIIASDHSIVPWTHEIDFNGFLAEQGFAQKKRSPRTLAKSLAKLALRPTHRGRMARTPVGDILATMTMSEGGGSAPRAFSGTYVYGIYVNDRDRFSGPVPGCEVSEETDRIIDSFNWTARQRQMPMTAVRYRDTFGEAPFSDVLPDVSIMQSGHAFPTSLGTHWYARNPNFGPVTTLKGASGMHSGQKGCKPILMTDTPLASLKRPDDPTDLRLVHRLTGRLYASE